MTYYDCHIILIRGIGCKRGIAIVVGATWMEPSGESGESGERGR